MFKLSIILIYIHTGTVNIFENINQFSAKSNEKKFFPENEHEKTTNYLMTISDRNSIKETEEYNCYENYQKIEEITMDHIYDITNMNPF